MDTRAIVIGDEKRLEEILSGEDINPLLRVAVEAGADEVSIRDETGVVLWAQGERKGPGTCIFQHPLKVEGEVVGNLSLVGGSGKKVVLGSLSLVLFQSVNAILTNKLKRILTTQVHTKVLDLSYEELVEKNRSLAASEEKYRALAENLDNKVRERTEELKDAHLRLLQQEKMNAIGQLAAGVAHEINNPLGFIISNLATLKKYAEKFLLVADSYRQYVSSGRIEFESACSKWNELKMDFLCADIMPLIEQSVSGAERVRKIVSDLKGFSHVDDGDVGFVDLNAEIERTLRVLSHDIPRDAVIVREYRNMELFPCNPGLLCQVFLNIIRNAIQARQHGLRLLIRSLRTDEGSVISFADNGPGIPSDIRTRIFEPFFTTRDVGSGQGLGLAVAYDIVTGYGGTVEVTCPESGGTVFTITLPAKEGT